MKKRTNIKDLARRATMALLLALMTTAPSWAGFQNFHAPIGNLEGCRGGRLAIHISGWTCDPYSETVDLSIETEYLMEYDRYITRATKWWYLHQPNLVEVHLFKDGREVKVTKVKPNVVRNDVIDNLHFYTGTV